ncbi:unnamed protein product [Cylicocyclus nassatus]|uniref:Uncharacterized protein n=1 Tax=Cylicocyclus nassatus TaxID=53992 RepID=A0AA36GNF2_CYLNA|nr:unnamed protein product [Cylicocyclus nassatus]
MWALCSEFIVVLQLLRTYSMLAYEVVQDALLEEATIFWSLFCIMGFSHADFLVAILTLLSSEASLMNSWHPVPMYSIYSYAGLQGWVLHIWVFCIEGEGEHCFQWNNCF